MTSNHFFIKKSFVSGPWLSLAGREHHHLNHVVRLRVQDEIWLFDEEGTRYRARIEAIGRQQTRLKLLEKLEPREYRSKITLAQAILKAKPMDWLVQKSTELGVVSIAPVLTGRCVVKLEERRASKVERWRQIAREASKQCRSGLVPSILTPRALKEFLLEAEADQKLFLSEHHGRLLKDVVGVVRDYDPPPNVIILVGPEGGWTAAEEVQVLSHGYKAVSLGQNILRAETASLAALAIIVHCWNS